MFLMENYTLEDLGKQYDLELDKVLEKIRETSAKVVLVQFPDGLKAYAVSVINYLQEKAGKDVEFLIWLGACFGACDYPVGLEQLKPKVDLMVQFGHSSLMPSYM